MRFGGRGGALLLGALVLAGAVAFGSRALGVAGIGLVLAGLAAGAWSTLARSRVDATFEVSPAPATEGDEVRIRVETRRSSRIPAGSASIRATLGRLGARECRLRGHGRRATGDLSLGRLPRGRYEAQEAVLELREPLGLETVEAALALPPPVLVHPRLVDLPALWNDAGRLGGDGRRLLLRRPAGFDFHSVREYEQGESLRRVHWPTTARRGQLMVKELEEAPSDAVAILLDCDPAGAAGRAPDSSFDVAVRAAGSIARAYCARGRKATLVTTARDAAAVPVASLEGDFGAALAVLASVEADAPHPLERALAAGRGPAAHAGELVVITGVLGPRVVERLLDTAAKRIVSVVWLDAPSFAGRPTRADPGVLRLTACGIPVAVVRCGDELAAALSLHRPEARAHG
jgi:uncharacterized protein (DUF58 family)